MNVPVRIGPEVRADFASLPSDALREQALRHLVALKKNPLQGQPLRDHPAYGDLGDCRKLYFDESRDRRPRYRIVYRLIPSGEDLPTAVDVVAIGRRAGAAVYFDALTRLGRADS